MADDKKTEAKVTVDAKELADKYKKLKLVTEAQEKALAEEIKRKEKIASKSINLAKKYGIGNLYEDENR